MIAHDPFVSLLDRRSQYGQRVTHYDDLLSAADVAAVVHDETSFAEFGVAVRDEWPLDPRVAYLNHGTVGVMPRRIIEAQRRIVDVLERNPAKYFLRQAADTGAFVSPPGAGETLMRTAAGRIASLVGAASRNVAFADNITTAANSALGSIDLKSGDEVLVTGLGYGGVTNAAVMAARRAGASVVSAEMPCPTAWPAGAVEAVCAAATDRTRVAVIDHLTSGSALLLPLAEIAAALRERGVVVIGDGAHVPGQLPLNIAALGVDYYAANLHKWGWAPRSAGILWVADEFLDSTHHAVTSWGLDNGFTHEFDFPGTQDISRYLTAPLGLELQRMVGFERIVSHNHDLVWRAAEQIAQSCGTVFATPEPMIASMATVPITDVDDHGERTPEDARQLELRINEGGVEVPVFCVDGQLRVRICAQIYNTDADVERLIDAVTTHLSHSG